MCEACVETVNNIPMEFLQLMEDRKVEITALINSLGSDAHKAFNIEVQHIDGVTTLDSVSPEERAEVEAAMDAAGESKNRSIQRFKGLGEVSAEDLADIVFSKSAKFEIVTLADGNLEQFAELAENGDENVATRRELIDAAIQMGDF